ncbi:MAG: nuclear transport factor 2 family protein [Thaumarchaeota archaeon]|nr:nuclear transport factor 2 family protein [Nitrosopumilaceae archaeon]NDF25868.1 nuclear transport factor 2 family protein [Nitrososphaerota archaeon]
MTKPTDIVNKFYETWNTKDVDTMASLLNDDVMYEGPLLTWNGKREYVKGAKELLPMCGQVKVLKQYVDDNSVLSILDITLNSPEGPIVCHTADQVELKNGKLYRTKAFYDPRKIAKYCSP